MKRTLLFGGLTLWASLSAFAQADEFDALAAAATDQPAQASSWGALKWSGDQEFAYRLGAYDPATRTGPLVDGKLSGEYKLGDLKVVAAGQVRNNEFVPGETAVFYSPGSFKFGLGWQEFSWGVADKKNPTDTLNARDYRYGADASRLVNPAATVAWYPQSWMSVEAVYEPWKVESKYPTNFAASTQAGLIDAKAKLVSKGLGPLLTGYNPSASAESTKEDFSNPVAGGRVNFFLSGVDLGFSYLYDRDSFYTPVVTMGSFASGTFQLPTKVELVYKRLHRFGLNAKTTIDKYGFWVESAYNKTEASSADSYDNRHDSIDWTLGSDFNFGPASAYYVNVQYAGTWVMDYDAATLKDYTSDLTSAQLADAAFMAKRTYRSLVQSEGNQTEQLMNTATISLKFPLADELVTPNFSAAAIVPWNYDDTKATRIASAYFKPEVDFKPVDGVHILFGADLVYGWVKKAGSSDVSLDTATDKLGIYTPQNSVYVKVDYQWNGSLGSN